MKENIDEDIDAGLVDDHDDATALPKSKDSAMPAQKGAAAKAKARSPALKGNAEGALRQRESSGASRVPVARASGGLFTQPVVLLIAAAFIFVLFNQYQIFTLQTMLSGGVESSGSLTSKTPNLAGKDLSGIDLSAIKSTGHTIAAVFPIDQIKTSADAMAMIFPTGTPEYGEALGVSYDDPVNSLNKLAGMFNSLRVEVEKSNPAAYARYVNLASNPYGVSCEYCCGIGPAGADKKGNSKCGCQHNPALLSITLYLTAYTDYTDGEILREVMRWKTLFFPKNMIELASSLAGGDTSSLDNLPGMVGGC